jgi:glycosyltransferase involved in cell wall biosynthesis
MYLSVIIPSYKSAGVLQNNIPYLADFLRKRGVSYEILIVDDGSNDDGLTRQASDKLGCRYLSNNTNQGKGAALKKGMLELKGSSAFLPMPISLLKPKPLRNFCITSIRKSLILWWATAPWRDRAITVKYPGCVRSQAPGFRSWWGVLWWEGCLIHSAA